jgi:hypothetical protein
VLLSNTVRRVWRGPEPQGLDVGVQYKEVVPRFYAAKTWSYLLCCTDEVIVAEPGSTHLHLDGIGNIFWAEPDNEWAQPGAGYHKTADGLTREVNPVLRLPLPYEPPPVTVSEDDRRKGMPFRSTIKRCLRTVARAMRLDSDYARSWRDNIACAIMDALVDEIPELRSQELRNKAANRVLDILRRMRD